MMVQRYFRVVDAARAGGDGKNVVPGFKVVVPRDTKSDQCYVGFIAGSSWSVTGPSVCPVRQCSSVQQLDAFDLIAEMGGVSPTRTRTATTGRAGMYRYCSTQCGGPLEVRRRDAALASTGGDLACLDEVHVVGVGRHALGGAVTSLGTKGAVVNQSFTKYGRRTRGTRIVPITFPDAFRAARRRS